MRTDISAFAKKSAVDQGAKQGRSHEETVVASSAQLVLGWWIVSDARMADADCFSRHFLRQPSWQQTLWPWELIPECQLALFILQDIEEGKGGLDGPLKISRFFQSPHLQVAPLATGTLALARPGEGSIPEMQASAGAPLWCSALQWRTTLHWFRPPPATKTGSLSPFATVTPVPQIHWPENAEYHQVQ